MNIEQFNTGSALLVDALWRAAWQGALATALVWILCWAVPKISPRVRSWLWRLVFLKFVLTFVWFAPLELPILRASQTHSLTPSIISAPNPVPSDPSSGPNSPPQPIPKTVSKTVSPPIPAPATLRWQSILAVFWLSGICLATSRLLWQFVQSRKLPRSAGPCADANLTDAVSELSRKLSLRSAPQLFVSNTSARPLLIGLLKPIIILPRDIVAHASPNSIHMMIAHELAHIRRGDLAWTLATAFIQALFFFNPAIWFARREYVLAQEIACDELAITVISREQHTVSAYAEMLLRIIATPASRTATHFTLGVADAKRTLERRIRHMNFIHAKRTKITRILAAVAISSLVFLQVPVRLVTAAAENSKETAAPAQQSTETPAAKSQSKSPILDNTGAIEIGPPKAGSDGPPSDPIAVTARRGGMIEKVLVNVGDRVTAGQPLLEMDSSEAKVQLRTAEARLRVAEADLEIARAEFTQDSNQYEIVRKMLENGRERADALPNIERSRGLLKKSEALLAVARSEVELAELTLSQFTVRAPADGIIWTIAAPGTWVPQEGGKLLAQIKNPDRERAASERKVVALREQLERLKRKRADLLVKYKEDHPVVISNKDQIDSYEASIREFQSAIK